jgi:hypothetical protein
MKSKLAMIIWAGAVAFNAQATPVTSTDWGEHGAVMTASVKPIGWFDNIFSFTLAVAGDLSSSAVSDNPHRPTDLKGGRVSLFSDLSGVESLLGDYDFDGASGNTTHNFGSLDAGDYHYLVSGMGTGANGGAYTIRSEFSDTPADSVTRAAADDAIGALATPLPEPGSVTLVLAALLALGWVASARPAHRQD